MNRRLEKALFAARNKQMPANWKVRYDITGFRRFTFVERLKILLGYNIVMNGALLMEHSPGRLAEAYTHTVTMQQSGEGALREETNL